MVLDESLVRRLLTTVDAGLVAGLGSPVPGQMCVVGGVAIAIAIAIANAAAAIDAARSKP